MRLLSGFNPVVRVDRAIQSGIVHFQTEDRGFVASHRLSPCSQRDSSRYEVDS